MICSALFAKYSSGAFSGYQWCSKLARRVQLTLTPFRIAGFALMRHIHLLYTLTLMQLCRVCRRSTWTSVGSSCCTWCLRRQVNVKTRCKAEPDVIPPGSAPSRLRALSCMHCFCLRPATHVHYFCYRTLPPSGECHWNSDTQSELISVDQPTKTGCHGNVSGGNVKQFSDLSSTFIDLTTPLIWRRLVPTNRYKNKKTEAEHKSFAAAGRAGGLKVICKCKRNSWLHLTYAYQHMQNWQRCPCATDDYGPKLLTSPRNKDWIH